MTNSLIDHILRSRQLKHLLQRLYRIPVLTEPYIGITHVPIGIVEFLIDSQRIFISIHSLLIQLQPLKGRRQIKPGQLIIRLLIDDMLMETNTLFITTGKISPETDLVQRFLISRI